MNPEEIPESTVTAPLFRREVAARKSDQIFGKILIPTSRIHTNLVLGGVLLVFALLLVLARGEVAGTTQALGVLETYPIAPLVYANQEGTVTKVWGEVGQKITKGEPILTISSGASNSGTGSSAGLLLSELQSEHDALMAQSVADTNLFDRQRIALRAKIRNSQNNLQINDRLLNLARERLRLASANLDRFRLAESKGAVSKQQIDEMRDRYLAAELAATEGELNLAQARDHVQALEASIAELPLKQMHRETLLRRDLLRLRRELLAAELRLGETVLSPVSGSISSLPAQVGEYISLGQVVARITPLDSKLRGVVLVPTRALSHIRQGDKVSIQYDAFPYQRYGQFSGSVELIDSVIQPSTQRKWPLNIQEPSVLAYVIIDDPLVHRQRVDITLQEGMIFRANIRHDNLKIYEWMIGPVIRIFQK